MNLEHVRVNNAQITAGVFASRLKGRRNGSPWHGKGWQWRGCTIKQSVPHISILRLHKLPHTSQLDCEFNHWLRVLAALPNFKVVWVCTNARRNSEVQYCGQDWTTRIILEIWGSCALVPRRQGSPGALMWSRKSLTRLSQQRPATVPKGVAGCLVVSATASLRKGPRGS